MSRVPTSHTNRPPIRAIGWATLALLAPGLAASATALGHCGDARPPTAPAAVRGAPLCATDGHPPRARALPLLPRRRQPRQRARHLPSARPRPDLSAVQTADATSGIGSAVGTGVSRSGSATRQ